MQPLHRARALLLAVAASAASAGCAPQPPADPLAGVWELDPARSHYSAAAERRSSETFACARAPGGVSCAIRSVRVDGRTVSGRFTAAYDGTASPVAGIPGVDRVRLRRVADRAVDATFSYRGSPAFGYRATRSRAGRSLTVVSVDPVTRSRLRSVVVYRLKRRD